MPDAPAYIFPAREQPKETSNEREKRPMQQNLYEVAIVKDTISNPTTGEKKTEILVSPSVITAINAQAARDKAVRLLNDDQAKSLDDCRIFIREFASSYASGWNK